MGDKAAEVFTYLQPQEWDEPRTQLKLISEEVEGPAGTKLFGQL